MNRVISVGRSFPAVKAEVAGAIQTSTLLEIYALHGSQLVIDVLRMTGFKLNFPLNLEIRLMTSYILAFIRCLDLSAACIDGVCSCLSRFYLKNGVCVAKISLGSGCDPSLDTCLDNRAICDVSSRTCTCAPGFYNKVFAN